MRRVTIALALSLCATFISACTQEPLPSRIAVLHLGGSTLDREALDLVGLHIRAEALTAAIPLLEEARTDTVVLRISSSAGSSDEALRIAQVIQTEFKPRFRTVTWVDTAWGSAVPIAWTADEVVMSSSGEIGLAFAWIESCLTWGPPAGRITSLEDWLAFGDRVSAWSGRDPVLMSALQSLHPLSYNIDAVGQRIWRADAHGQVVITHGNSDFRLNAATAVSLDIAVGIADSSAELAMSLGHASGAWVGKDADALLQRHAVEAEQRRRISEQLWLDYHAALGEPVTEMRRGAGTPSIEATARRHFKALETLIREYPYLSFWALGMSDLQWLEWRHNQQQRFARSQRSFSRVPKLRRGRRIAGVQGRSHGHAFRPDHGTRRVTILSSPPAPDWAHQS